MLCMRGAAEDDTVASFKGQVSGLGTGRQLKQVAAELLISTNMLARLQSAEWMGTRKDAARDNRERLSEAHCRTHEWLRRLVTMHSHQD